jgi:twinkle protein
MNTAEQIKNRVDIVDLISGFIKLKKEGVNLVGKCPFHDEKTGSFTVSPAKQIYKCFGCGKSGDAIQFVVEHEKKSFLEATEWIAEKYGIEFEAKRQVVKPVPRLEHVSKKVIEYFEKRGIQNNTLLRMKITEAKEWMPMHNKEVDTICFNYFRNDELTNIKFKGPKFIDSATKKEKKCFKLSKDAEIIFYNIDSLKDEKTAIIVEGEIDALSLIEAGIFNVVSVPNGTPPPDRSGNYCPKLEYLDNCWMDFEGKEKIIIATDNDYVGKLLREELGRRLGKERCFQVEYPESCKDFNDVLVKCGKTAIQDIIANAKEWPLEGIIAMDEIYEDIEYWYENGYPTGEKSNIDGLDDLLTFGPGQVTTVTGIPGHGKDEFTNDIMVSLSKWHGWQWATADFEEPAAYLVTKLQEKFTRKSFAFRKNPSDRMSRREFERALVFVADCFHFINIQQIDATIDGILAKATELVKRKGIKGLRINPWNCIEHKRPPGMSETEYVSEVYTKLCNWAVCHGVHVIIIAHPTKVKKNEKTSKYEVPTLYSISGSANFFNKTYNGICVYRDYETNITEVYVQKVKWSWFGQIGWSSYQYNVDTRQYNFLSTSVIKRMDSEEDSLAA